MKIEEFNQDTQRTIRQVMAREDAALLAKRKPLGEGDKDALILRDEHGKATHIVYPPPDKPKTRIRQSSKPLMNKLETEWYHVLKSTYPPECPVFSQAIRFRLGNGIWYKPDFIVFGTGQAYGYEVKGPHAFRGGFENLKVCANLYREIKWYLVWKGDLGQWQEQTILP